MRHYLYIWHDPAEQMIVASGIEFRDLLPALLDAGGVLLLKGDARVAQTGMLHVPRQQLPTLASEDIAAWGSHAWADYADDAAAVLPPPDDARLAEARYFARHGTPQHQPRIAVLRNRFIAYAHDDGWYLKLFYSAWSDVADFLAAAVPAAIGALDMAALQRGDAGCWLQGGVAHAEVKTHDIDSVLNRRL